MGDIWLALGLTVFAGMATGIGSVIAFMTKRTDYRFLSTATGFSAGVMLYVSFVEILAQGAESLTAQFGEAWGPWINVALFFAGMALIGVIDNLIPSAENPHEVHSQLEARPLHNGTAVIPFATPGGEGLGEHIHQRKLLRMGILTALAIGIHNFPEGLATFLAALQDPHLGVAIAAAIALHNIPEGISVSVPIFYATGNRRKAFIYSLLCGLAEPVGAAVGFLALLLLAGGDNGPLSTSITGMTFGAVAGIMVYISLDELLPTSRACGKGHDSLFGLVGGMAVMAVSLLLMR